MNNWTHIAALAALSLLFSCSSSAAGDTGREVKGVYENAQANASIEFLGEGKAHFSFHGAGGECKYRVEGRTVTLVVDGETTVFTLNPDGSLTGPPDSFLSRLKRKK